MSDSFTIDCKEDGYEKTLVILVAFMMVCSLILPVEILAYYPDNPDSTGDLHQLRVIAHSRAETVSSNVDAQKLIETANTCKNEIDGSYTSTVTSVYSISQERGSQGKTINDNICISTLSLTYSFRSNGEDIKITNVSGSWVANYSYVPIDYQSGYVYAYDGVPMTGEMIERYPAVPSFSYNTGWDYVQFYPSGVSALGGVRALSDGYYVISGMGGTPVKITNFLELVFVDS